MAPLAENNLSRQYTQLPSPLRGILTKKGREHVRLFDVGPDQNLSVLYFSFIRLNFQGLIRFKNPLFSMNKAHQAPVQKTC